MTVDTNFVRFHKQIGQTISSKKGILGGLRVHLKAHLCGTYGLNGNVCVTGNETGELVLWKDEKAVDLLNQGKDLHTQGVNTIIFEESEGKFISGASNGHVRVWDDKCNLLHSIDIQKMVNKNNGIRSLDFSGVSNKQFLVGTAGG
jgi:WD40 repeat protein